MQFSCWKYLQDCLKRTVCVAMVEGSEGQLWNRPVNAGHVIQDYSPVQKSEASY